MDTKKMLECQADQIEAVLARHGAPGRVTGGTITPRCIRFWVQPAMGARIGSVESLGAEIATALNVPALVTRNGSEVQIEIVRPDPQPVTLLGMLRGLRDVPAMTAVIGLCDDGAPLLARLTSEEACSVLIAGRDSLPLLVTMIVSLLLRHPDPTEMMIVPVGTGLEALASNVLHFCNCSLTELRQLAEDGGKHWPIVVAMTPGGFGDVADDPDFAWLLANGREHSIYIVAATFADTRDLPFALRILEIPGGYGDYEARAGNELLYRFTPATIGAGEAQQIVAEIASR